MDPRKKHKKKYSNEASTSKTPPKQTLSKNGFTIISKAVFSPPSSPKTPTQSTTTTSTNPPPPPSKPGIIEGTKQAENEEKCTPTAQEQPQECNFPLPNASCPFVTSQQVEQAYFNLIPSLNNDYNLKSDLANEEFTEEQLNEFLAYTEEEYEDDLEAYSAAEGYFHSIHTNNSLLQKMDDMEVNQQEMSTSKSSKKRLSEREDDTASSHSKRSKTRM